jgi:protein-tyrosine phosphatase
MPHQHHPAMTLALSKLNFRDLGGLPTLDGKVIRSGVLFRSEGPASFFDEHRAELGALGVRSVCDLRSGSERTAAPNDWCGPGCRVLHLDMNTDLRAAGAEEWESLRRDPSAANARRVMINNYCLMPAALSPHLAKIVAALLASEVPMVVHCTAGKDRTGVAIALLLTLLRVGREDILSDYTKSDVFGRNLRMAGSVNEAFHASFGFVPSEAAISMLIGTDRGFLLAALATVGREWGSIDAYFEASGVSADRREQLRAMVLE